MKIDEQMEQNTKSKGGNINPKDRQVLTDGYT